jgi:hypothetical protein
MISYQILEEQIPKFVKRRFMQHNSLIEDVKRIRLGYKNKNSCMYWLYFTVRIASVISIILKKRLSFSEKKLTSKIVIQDG